MDVATYKDECIYQARQLADLTRDGKINWELVDYAPISFMLGNEDDEAEPYLAQTLTLEVELNGEKFELEIFESIDFRTKKGDISIELERHGSAGYTKYEDALSYSGDAYDECPAEKLADTFKDHTAVLLASVTSSILESEDVQETFEWARFVNEMGVNKSLTAHPLYKLGRKLFNEHNSLAFYRCVLDWDYRQSLLNELR